MTLAAKQPIHAANAERATLGAMLLNKDAIPIIVSVLGDNPDVFGMPPHREIYRAILEVYRNGQTLDLLSLHSHLSEFGNLEESGGMSYIASLTDAVETSANAAHYASFVQKDAQKRNLMDSCRRTLNILERNQQTPEEAIQALIETTRANRPTSFTSTSLLNWRELATAQIDQIFDEGLAIGCMGVLTADGGSGKSFLALELALSVALGRKIIDNFTPTAEGRVLCCFGEDDDRVVAHRLKAISEGLSIDQNHIHGALQFNKLQFINGQSSPLLNIDPMGGISRSAGFMELQDRCQRERYRLIIIDPLVSWAGIANENDNAAMQAVALALIDIANASGGAVLCLHHSNKGSTRAGDVSQASSRGASSLLCAARWVAAMRTLHKKEGDRLGIDPENLHKFVEVHVSKNSYAERNGAATMLQRIKGGALRPIDLKGSREEMVALAMVEVLDLMPEKGGLTKREMVKGEGDIAIKFRDDLTDKLGFTASRETVAMGLAHGLKSNYIEERLGAQNRTAGRPREEVFVSEF